MADKKREELLKRNQEFVSLPNPKLDGLSNEELAKRGDILDATFSELFDDDESNDE